MKLYSSSSTIVPLFLQQHYFPISEELERLTVENSKLKYRLGILKRATNKATKAKIPTMTEVNQRKYMLSCLASLEDSFSSAIKEAFPDIPDPPCPVQASAKFSDYQFNGAMAIAGILKASGIKMPPRDIANKIVSCVKLSTDDKNSIISKLDVAGPGFVNIFLDNKFVCNQILSLLKNERIVM